MKNAPYVSVIVPYFNAEKTIKKLLESLLRQSYPPDSYEIVMVDNGSTDNSNKIIEKFPVKVITEARIKSSYAARNAGVLQAKGEIFAFIDSDCIAAQNWIQNGVIKLREDNADIAGGKITFILSKSMSSAEIYDAITHLDSGKNIKEMKAAATGNLFVRSIVFQNIGLFPEVKSGGDMQFTNKAVNAGYKLVFAPDARVFHPTRNFKEMIKKSYRVGTGSIDVLMSSHTGRGKILLRIAKDFLPQSISSIKRNISEKGTKEMEKKLFSIFFVGYACRVARGLGMISNISRMFKKTGPIPQRNLVASNISG